MAIYRVAVIWKVKGGTNVLIQSVPGESAGAYMPLEVTSVPTEENHAPKFSSHHNSLLQLILRNLRKCTEN